MRPHISLVLLAVLAPAVALLQAPTAAVRLCSRPPSTRRTAIAPSRPHLASRVCTPVRLSSVESDEPDAADAEAAAAPAPLVLDATSKLQLSILLATNFLVQMGIGMIIVILPLFAQVPTPQPNPNLASP